MAVNSLYISKIYVNWNQCVYIQYRYYIYIHIHVHISTQTPFAFSTLINITSS